MGLFNTILQKLGFVKDKAVEAVAGENAAAAEAPVSPVEAVAVETVAAAPAAAETPAGSPEIVDVALSAKLWLPRTHRNSTGKLLLLTL